jgi:hypothetical protein
MFQSYRQVKDLTASMQAKQTEKLITELGCKLMIYAFKPGDRVELPRMHCRRCHYTSKLRVELAPQRCANTTGYVDSEGNERPACHTWLWGKWPDDFDIQTCKCLDCLLIWRREKEEVEKSGGNELALEKSAGLVPLSPRRRGRPPKYKKN